jgi:hypothetical protein
VIKSFWHEPTISAATDFVCAVDINHDVRCWSSDVLKEVNAKHAHPANIIYRTVAASVHGDWEIITVVDDKGNVFVAGQGTPSSKVLIPATTLSEPVYRYAFTGYYRDYQCGLKQNYQIECMSSPLIKTSIDKTQVIDISHGFDAFCLINGDYHIKCSANDTIQKAIAATLPAGEFERIAIPADAMVAATEIAACAVERNNHYVVCFGNAALPAVAKAPKDFKAQSVAVGGAGLFAVALDKDGKLHWWGDDSNAYVKRVRDDIATSGTDEMVAIVAGGWSQTATKGLGAYACSVKKDGTPVCFGDAKLKANLLAQGAFKVKIYPPVAITEAK